MHQLSDSDLVLEVGSGSSPWPRSDVLLDRYYVDETGQRGGGEIFRDRRPMVVAAGERLPFKDKAFDFVYCSHVIEHAEDIGSMLNEMSRVAKAGFIECPNPILERILDQEHHNWYITNVNGSLLITPKNLENNVSTRVDRFFFHMMSDYFIVRHNWELFVTRMHWQGRIQFEICADVERVFREQHIPDQLPILVQNNLEHVLRKAWWDSRKDAIMQRLKASRLYVPLRRLLGKFRRWRRNQVQPRLAPEAFRALLECPHCHADLNRDAEGYACVGCGRQYQESDGVSVLL